MYNSAEALQELQTVQLETTMLKSGRPDCQTVLGPSSLSVFGYPIYRS